MTPVVVGEGFVTERGDDLPERVRLVAPARAPAAHALPEERDLIAAAEPFGVREMLEIETEEAPAAASQGGPFLAPLVVGWSRPVAGREPGVTVGIQFGALARRGRRERRRLWATREDLDDRPGPGTVGRLGVVSRRRLSDAPNQLVEGALAPLIARQPGTSQELGPGEHRLRAEPLPDLGLEPGDR